MIVNITRTISKVVLWIIQYRIYLSKSRSYGQSLSKNHVGQAQFPVENSCSHKNIIEIALSLKNNFLLFLEPKLLG